MTLRKKIFKIVVDERKKNFKFIIQKIIFFKKKNGSLIVGEIWLKINID